MTSKVIIRETKLHDLNGMKQVNERCLQENYPLHFWKSTWETNKACCFVAVSGGLIVGYILCSADCVVSFAVEAPFRKNQIGNSLIKHALNNFKTDVILNVRRSNVNAIHLYKSHGFQEMKVIVGYYHKPNEDSIEMIRHYDASVPLYPIVSKLTAHATP
jgi:ribosomal protein S18 acetylase RimI-like enzyme